MTNSWLWSELARLEFKEGSLALSLGPLVWLVGLVLLGIGIYLWFKHRRSIPKHYEIVKTTLKIANLGDVEIVPNHETIRIAYQAWVELTTRKAGLPFDEKHDVIVEVYNSWYELFGRLRDLTRGIPSHRLRECEDTRKLVGIMVRVLNDGLRPHLTAWQARFRKWYEEEKEKPESRGLSPQDIQQKYKDYRLLIDDLKKVQTDIVDYTNWLKKIADGSK